MPTAKRCGKRTSPLRLRRCGCPTATPWLRAWEHSRWSSWIGKAKRSGGRRWTAARGAPAAADLQEERLDELEPIRNPPIGLAGYRLVARRCRGAGRRRRRRAAFEIRARGHGRSGPVGVLPQTVADGRRAEEDSGPDSKAGG